MAGMPRSDIYINLPALRKLDTMLLVRQAPLLWFLFQTVLLFLENTDIWLTNFCQNLETT